MPFFTKSNPFFQAVAILIVIIFMLFMPGGLASKQKRKLMRISFAQRGLCFGKDKAQENTTEAVVKAAKAGYGSQIDVRLTKDFIPVVFADATLKRATQRDKRISECSFSELADLKLFRKGPIQRLDVLLEEVSQLENPPILLLRLCPDDNQLDTVNVFCECIANVMYPYRSFAVVESSYASVLRYFKNNFSNIIRGQVLHLPEDTPLSPSENRRALAMLQNFTGRPQFYDIPAELYQPLRFQIAVSFGAPILIRDINGEEEQMEVLEKAGVTGVIFQSGTPKTFQ